MAKKRTIDLDNAEPLRDLPSSGVQVNYKHQTIIASDETSEYALLTGGKICEANIGVVYIKPAEPVVNITYDGDVTGQWPATAHPGEFIELTTITTANSLDDFEIFITTDASGNIVPHYAEVIVINVNPHELHVGFYAPDEDITVTVNRVE